MKHIFLINPVAGRGKASVETLPRIIEAVKEKGVDYEIHRTVNEGDAFRYTRARCAEYPAEDVRFYSCGGDGTMNEVLNGLYGFPRAQLAVIPAGTGNDFVRNFSDWQRFRDIDLQIDGNPVPVDVIRYELLDEAAGNEEINSTGVSERTREDSNQSAEKIAPTGYALNMFNMGFDAEVVAKTSEIKGKPFMNGTSAYIGGVGIVLAKLGKLDMTAEVDGKEVASGKFLLASVANGRFSGGGFDGCPLALTDDGEMDVLIVRSVTRRFFLSIVKKYHDGTHIGDPRLDDILTHYRCKEAIFRPRSEMVMAKDGETARVGAVKFTVVPHAVNLSIPAEREAAVRDDFPREAEQTQR
jgi:diacylglycerol kinase family enzyme